MKFFKDLGGNALWEDSDAKQFYEDIPDLKLFLPSYASREPPPSTTVTPQSSEGDIYAKTSINFYIALLQ